MTSPAFDQDSVQGRCYGNNETNGLWITTSNVDFNRAAGSPWRIRFLIQEYNNKAVNNKAFKLQRNWSGGGGWVDVTTSSSVVRAFSHPFVNDNSDTTQQIGAGTYIANNNGISHDGVTDGTVDYAGNDEAEFEFFVIIIPGDVSINDTIDFRMVETDDTVLDNYNFTPTVTIIDPVYTSLGVNDRATTISAVSGTGPWTVTITDGSVAKEGDALWDENAAPRKYRITGISGNDLTVVDSEGVGSAPDNSGTSTPYVKRYYTGISGFESDLDDTDLYSAGDDAIAQYYADADFNESATTINGGSTVKLNSVWVTAASGEEHAGILGGGARIRGGSVTGNILNVTHAQLTVIRDIEIDFNGDSGDSGANVGIIVNNSGAILYINRSMIHGTARRLSRLIEETSGYIVANNNWLFDLVYPGTSAAIPSAAIRSNSARDQQYYNNTIHKIQFTNASNTQSIYGITFSDITAHDAQNNIATDVTTAGTGTASCYNPTSPSNATMDYNLASDTSAAGLNSLNSKTSANQYISNTAPFNLFLVGSTVDADEEGYDFGAPVFYEPHIDIKLYDRDAGGGVWDMGGGELILETLTAAITTSGDIAADLTIQAGATEPLVADISASGNLTASLTERTKLTAGISASGDLAADIERTRNLPVSISASGDIAANLLRTRSIDVSISADGDLAADVVRNKLAISSSIITSGDVTANVNKTIKFVASITTSGNLAADVERTRNLPTSITTSGDLAADVVRNKLAISSSITTSGDLTADIKRTRNLPTNISANGDITADVTKTLKLTTAINADGDLAADIVRNKLAISSNITTSGDLAADVVRNKLAISSSITTSGDLTADILRTIGLTTGIVTSGDIAADLIIKGVIESLAVSITADGDIAVNLLRTRSLIASITTDGDLTADVIRNKLAISVSVTGSGDLVADLSTTTPLSITLNNTALLVADLSRIRGFISTIVTSGNLVADVKRKRGLLGGIQSSASVAADLSKTSVISPWFYRNRAINKVLD